MMKNLLLIAAFVAMALGPGCENANLFDSPPAPPQNKYGLGPSGELVIAMDVQGGFAGVHRNLSIQSNGYIRYVDYHHPGGQIISMLKPEEFEALVAFFLEKDFLNLGESYFEPNTADAFIYSLRFLHGGRDKTVGTDGLNVPANLHGLIARLQQVIETLQQNSVTLSFEMDRQVLRHGETVDLTLTATNQQSRALQLASGVQMFEFFALPTSAAPTEPVEWSSAAAWNYTYGKVYILVMQYTTLAPGESLTFRATWDGRSNDGELLEGNYLVGAQLLTAPGGLTGLQALQIVE